MSAVPMTRPPVPIKAPMPAAVAKPPAPMVKPTVIRAGAAPAHKPKTFAVQEWDAGSQGEKIILYGKSGVGKSTLACMAPNSIFIGIDDGGRRLVNPMTGEKVKHVPGVVTFQDLRDALKQDTLFPDKATIVIDTVTKVETILDEYIFANYTVKGGARAKTMREFGWDGPAHVLDCFRLLLSDLDAHVRKGRNVILLAQMAPAKIANSQGLDYQEDGPKLQHNGQYSTRAEVCEWADHVLFVGYSDMTVEKEDPKAKTGKVKSGEMSRCVYSGGAMHFIAKSRPINGYRIPPAIGFDKPADNGIWQFVFEGAKAE